MSTRKTNGKGYSGGGNLSRRAQTTPMQDAGGPMLKATTVAFSSTDTITDSGNDLARFAAGQRIQVRGSPLNSRVWTVVTSAAGTLTVTPAIVTSETAGAAIIITQDEC